MQLFKKHGVWERNETTAVTETTAPSSRASHLHYVNVASFAIQVCTPQEAKVIIRYSPSSKSPQHKQIWVSNILSKASILIPNPHLCLTGF